MTPTYYYPELVSFFIHNVLLIPKVQEVLVCFSTTLQSLE